MSFAMNSDMKERSVSPLPPRHAVTVSYIQDELSDELLIHIFSYLTVQDVCRVIQTCKRLQIVANDSLLWKSLYKQLYNYSYPLFNPAANEFYFMIPEETGFKNPWKESCYELHHGVHVKPDCDSPMFCGKKCFKTVKEALFFITIQQLETGNTDTSKKLIFLHHNNLRIENVTLNGPASKNVFDKKIGTLIFFNGQDMKPYVGQHLLDWRFYPRTHWYSTIGIHMKAIYIPILDQYTSTIHSPLFSLNVIF